MRGAYFVLKTTGVQKCDETNERGDTSISIGGVDDEQEQKGLEARHVRWRQSTRKLRKDDLQTITHIIPLEMLTLLAVDTAGQTMTQNRSSQAISCVGVSSKTQES